MGEQTPLKTAIHARSIPSLRRHAAGDQSVDVLEPLEQGDKTGVRETYWIAADTGNEFDG